MADNTVIPFSMAITSKNSKSVGNLYKDDIVNMTIDEFLEIDGKLMRVVRRVRYDTIVFQPTLIKADTHKGSAFRDGLNEEARYATDKTVNGKYEKTKSHTNMTLNGAFEKDDFVIIKAIAVPLTFTAGVPTTVVDGIITDPTANLSKVNYDPFLHCETFAKSFSLSYQESNKTKIEGRLSDFPMVAGGMSGSLGASPGGVAQNAFLSSNALNRPRIIEGLQSFNIIINPENDVDLTSYGKQYGMEVQIHTTELINERA